MHVQFLHKDIQNYWLADFLTQVLFIGKKGEVGYC